MQTRLSFVILTGVFATTLYTAAGAQAPASVAAGVYTVEQAKRGAALYAEHCAACHGAELAGAEPMPGLVGADFQGRWKNVGDLFDKTITSMPATAPGSLTEAQVADVVAHMLAVNKYPAGSTELSSKVDVLTAITFEPAK